MGSSKTSDASDIRCTSNARLVVPREEVYASEVAHAAIPVDKMSAAGVDSGELYPETNCGRGTSKSPRAKEGQRVIRWRLAVGQK